VALSVGFHTSGLLVQRVGAENVAKMVAGWEAAAAVGRCAAAVGRALLLVDALLLLTTMLMLPLLLWCCGCNCWCVWLQSRPQRFRTKKCTSVDKNVFLPGLRLLATACDMLM
jgi:hypothetical protein